MALESNIDDYLFDPAKRNVLQSETTPMDITQSSEQELDHHDYFFDPDKRNAVQSESKQSPKEVLRSKYKQLYGECLMKLTESTAFIEYWKTLGLHQKGYHFKQIEAKHCEDVIHILSYQFSSTGSLSRNQLFIVSVDAKFPLFKATIDWTVETGLGFVILDKNDKVCAVSLSHDICDQNPNPHISKDKNLIHVMELVHTHRNIDNIWYQMIGNKRAKNEWEKGEVAYENINAVASPLVHEGIESHGVSQIIFGMMGYKLYYSTTANIVTVQRISQLPFVYASKPFDFSNFVFNDGAKMSDYYLTFSTNNKWNICFSA